MMKMRCVSWLSAALLVCVCGSVVDGQTWDITDCDDLDSQDKIIECIRQCRLKNLISGSNTIILNQQPNSQEDEEEEEEEDSLSLGVLLSSLSLPDASRDQLPGTRPQRSDEGPTYSMEHFRWGKPTGRKRRPVKVHTTAYMDDEDQEDPSTETLFPSLTRRQLDRNAEREQKNSESTTKYRITHFRWSAPPASKRYGGFMKPWSQSSHKPLLTLLRNIIVKNTQ